jgi:hypothetical protein
VAAKYNFDSFDAVKLKKINYNVKEILNDLGVKTIKNDEWLNFCCPLHNDKSPSAGVWLPYGIFRCFVCGSFSFPRLLCQWLDKNYDEVDEILAKYDTEIFQKITGNHLQSAFDIATIGVEIEDTDAVFASWVRTKGIPIKGFKYYDELLQEYDEYYNMGNFELASEYAKEVMLNG